MVHSQKKSSRHSTAKGLGNSGRRHFMKLADSKGLVRQKSSGLYLYQKAQPAQFWDSARGQHKALGSNKGTSSHT